jgi:hypothetical protein
MAQVQVGGSQRPEAAAAPGSNTDIMPSGDCNSIIDQKSSADFVATLDIA